MKYKYNRKPCPKCNRSYGINMWKRHVSTCKGFKTCPVCDKQYLKEGRTCSYSCSNKLFRSGENNGNWKQDAYRTTCFKHHGKKCIVCGEEKIVTVHHINENHSDNRPENLIPLCPTHHQYVHSRYKNEVQPYIDKFLGVG